MRTKKLYFVELYNGQIIENSFFKRSEMIWNKTLDDKANSSGIPLTYQQTKTKFKTYFLFLIKEDPAVANYVMCSWKKFQFIYGKTVTPFVISLIYNIHVKIKTCF